ncbi:MAG: SDR family NAD(P)-dependent oxidoreductase [Saprospiraceae bacterium]
MTISIVGCGWLGLPFGEYLIEKGLKVKGSTTTAKKLKVLENKGIQPFLIDLKSIVLNKILNQEQLKNIDDFFHTDILYINIPPGRRNPNVLNDYPKWIQFLIKKCEEFDIRKVIFVSSTGVYPNTNGIVTEAIKPEPQTDSQKSIVIAEQLLQRNQHFETTILRPAGLVGGNRIAGRWFAGKQNIKGGNIPINLVHLDDCIGVSYAVIRQDMFGKIFNICADEHPIKGKFYPLQAEKYGFEIPTFLMEQPKGFKIISNKLSKKILNYKYKRPNPMNF